MEQEEYDITRCVNVLAEMPQFRATMKRPPLLALLHRQRNLVQHTGEAVSDDLLTLLVASGVKLYLEWARLFFGVELDDLFPNRHSLALPNFDIDVRAVQERYIAKLRDAAHSASVSQSVGHILHSLAIDPGSISMLTPTTCSTVMTRYGALTLELERARTARITSRWGPLDQR